MQTTEQLKEEIRGLKSSVEELGVLNELALAVGFSFDANQVLDIILQKSVKAVRAEQGSIKLVTEKVDKPLHTLIRREDLSGPMRTYRVDTHITGWVLKNHKPLMIENLADDKRFSSTEKERQEIHSVLCVPIWLRAKIIGILLVTNKKTGESFNSNDLRLLSIIAAQSGQLIRNSQLQEEALEKNRLKHELELACKIQLSLLPEKDPSIPGMEVASYFKPAEVVGGDYFDYLELRNDQLGIVIADVSGHGPSAALIMTLMKGIIHSITKNFDSTDQVLQEVNHTIGRIVPEEVFVTMQFLLIDLKNGILRFSNAGHNPLLLYTSKTNTCSIVELTGCALNLLSDYDYPLKQISLGSGDLLLASTDGITEAANEHQEMFGLERLSAAIENSAKEPAGQIIEHVKKQLRIFTGRTEQADDMAIVAIKIS